MVLVVEEVGEFSEDMVQMQRVRKEAGPVKPLSPVQVACCLSQAQQ